MNVIKRIVLAIRGGSAFGKDEAMIEPAFISGGVQYYQHTDELKLPYKRALAALTVYNEISSGVDAHYITKWGEAFDNLTNGAKFGVNELSEIVKLRKILKQRLEYVQPADLYYKLASIRFFTQEENVHEYDYKYNIKKIEHWKKHDDVNTFFLRRPVKKLIPFLGLEEANLSSSLRLAEELDKIQLESIYQNLQPNQKTTFGNSLFRYFTREMQQEKSA